MRRLMTMILVIALLAVSAPRVLGADAPPVVRPGSSGTQIAILQAMLHAIGRSVQITGTYDDATKQAVVAFQKEKGLIADGEVAAKTWAALAEQSGTQVGGGTLRYTVQPGDSLGGIAVRFDSSSAGLLSWNNLKDANHIEAGMKLSLVAPGSGPALNQPAPASTAGTGAAPAGNSAAVAPPAPAAGGAAVPAMVLLPGSLTIEAAPTTGPAAEKGAAAERAPVSYRPPGDKPLALTFCDLPTAADLPDLLRILKESGVQATFFVGGEEAERSPETVKALVTAGQEVENHGYQHRIWAGQSPSLQQADLLRTQHILTDLTGRAPRYYRPPGGSYDANLQASVQRVKLQMVMWSSINARDQDDVSDAELAEAMKNAAFPGAVLMLHAGRSATIGALPGVINALHESGFASVPLEQLLAKQ